MYPRDDAAETHSAILACDGSAQEWSGPRRKASGWAGPRVTDRPTGSMWSSALRFRVRGQAGIQPALGKCNATTQRAKEIAGTIYAHSSWLIVHAGTQRSRKPLVCLGAQAFFVLRCRSQARVESLQYISRPTKLSQSCISNM